MTKSFYSKFALVALVLASVIFSSCSSESLDGDWEKMKWEKVNYDVAAVDGVAMYAVPAEGGVFQFKCKNYKGFWLENAQVGETHNWTDVENFTFVHPMREGNDYRTISDDRFKISVGDDGVMTVAFYENSGNTRFVKLAVTAGDIFDSFCFVQSAAVSAK